MQLNQYQQQPQQQPMMVPQQPQPQQYYPQQMPMMQQTPVRTEQQKMFDIMSEQQNALILLNNKIDTLLSAQQEYYSTSVQATDIIAGLEERITVLEKQNQELKDKINESPKVDLEELVSFVVNKNKPGLQSKKVVKE